MNGKDFKLFVIDAVNAGLNLFNECLIDIFKTIQQHTIIKIKLICFWVLLWHSILEMRVARRNIKELLHSIFLWFLITSSILQQENKFRLIVNQQIISNTIIENRAKNVGRLLITCSLTFDVFKLTLGWFFLDLVNDAAVSNGKLFVF